MRIPLDRKSRSVARLLLHRCPTAVLLVAAVLVIMCTHPCAAVTCAVGQWCWQQGWEKQYYVYPSTAVSASVASQSCSSMNSSVVDAVAALGSVLAAGSTSWTSLNITNAATPLSLFASRLETTQWDACWDPSACCFVVLGGSGFVSGVPCSGTVARLVICQKDGAPAAWSMLTTRFESEFEYGYFSWTGSFDEAAATCRQYGGSLATIPAAPSSSFAALLAVSSGFWVGFRVGSSGSGYWNGSTVSFTPAVPFTTSNRCSSVATTAGSSYSAVDCSTTRLPFLCQRLKEPSTSAYCITSTPSVLQYSTAAATAYTTSSLRGYLPSAAIQYCADRNGAVTKFSAAVVAALNTCYGQPSDIIGTIFGNGIWLDSSTATIPAYFSAVASAPCTYFNRSTPSAGSANCSTPLPTVCEFTTAPALVVSSTLTMGGACRVASTASLTTPARVPIQYLYNSTLGVAGTAFAFPQFSTTSTTTMSFAPSLLQQSGSVVLKCNSTAPADCSQAQLSISVAYTGIVTYLQIVQTVGANVTSSIDSTLTPVARTGWIGAPLLLDAISIPASAAGSNITVTFALIAIANATLCSVRPTTAVLDSYQPSVRPTVFCNGGSNSTVFRVAMTTISNRNDHCQLIDYTSQVVFEVSMKLFLYVVDNRVPVVTAYTLLNNAPTATFTFLQAPNGYLAPTWVCLKPSSVNVSSVSLATFGGVACLSSASSSPSLVLTFNMGTTTAAAIRVALTLTGPASSAYDASRSVLLVDITLALIPVTFVSPIYERPVGYTFINTPFTIMATIPTAFPSGRNLTIEATLNNLVSGSPDPGFVYLAFAAGTTSTNVSSTTPTDLTGNRDNRLFTPTRLIGDAASFFYLNTTAQPFRVWPATPLNVDPYVPQYVYIGKPFVMTISTPDVNPLRLDSFTYTLACASPSLCTSIGLTISPASIMFSSTGILPASRSITITGLNAQAAVSLQWSLSPALPRYVRLANFSVSVRAQLSATVAPFPTKACYFDNINYTVRVVATSAAPQAYALFSLNNTTAVSMTSVANLTTAVQVASMAVVLLPTSSAVTAITSSILVSGPDQQAFSLSPATVTFSPFKPRVQVTVTGAPQLLIAESTASTTLTISLDRAPVVSQNVTLRIASVGALVSISSPLLVWQLGDNTTRQVTITTCGATSCANTAHYITFTTSAVQDDGTNTFEVKREVNVYVTNVNSSINLVTTNTTGVLALPVVALGTISFQVANPIPLRLNEALPFTIALSTLPFVGVLNITIEASLNVQMTPPFVLFAASATSSVAAVTLTGIIAQKREIIRVIVAGTASALYTTPLQMCSYVDGTLALVLAATNLVAGRQQLISTQAPAVFAVTIPTPAAQDCSPTEPVIPRQLPTATHSLMVSVVALYDGYASVGVTLEPSLFLWTSASSSNLSQFLYVTPTGLTLEPSVTIVGTVFGNASSYVGFSVPLAILPPANVNVVFPTSKVFPKEVASINITVDRRVTVTTASLTASLRIDSSNCTNVAVTADTVTFTANDAGVSAFLTFLPADTTLVELCIVAVSVVLGGTAIGEFIVPSTLSSVVTFVPRRKVIFTLPKYTFDRTYFEFNVTLEELPDVGQTVSFRSTLGLVLSPTWTATSPATQKLALAPPYLLPGNNTIPITLDASAFEQNRYEDVVALEAVTLTKLTLSLAGPSIKYYQVIGAANYQVVTFTLSRAPLVESDVVATLQLTSVVNSLLLFEPSEFSWSSTDTSLERSLHIVGNALGSAQGLQFVFSSNFSQELGTPDASGVILPPNMTILEQYRLTVSTPLYTMYVNAVNQQVLNVTLQMPSFAAISKTLTVSVVFVGQTTSINPSIASLNITPSFVSFTNATRGPQSKFVTIAGVTPGIGRLQLVPDFTPEISTVVPGFDTMEVRPLVRFDIILGGSVVDNTTNASIRSNDVTTLTLSMSSFAANVTAQLYISSVLTEMGTQELPTYNSNGTVTLGDSVAIIITPHTFVFDDSNVATLARTFTVSCVAMQGATIVLGVQWTNTTLARAFSPPYITTLRVLRDWTVQSSNFPLSVFDGVRNTATFSIDLMDATTKTIATASAIAASPRSVVAVSIVPAPSCAGNVQFTAQRDLIWTASLFASPTVAVNATTKSVVAAPCQLNVYLASPLSVLLAQLEPAANTTRRLLLMINTTLPRSSPLLDGPMTATITNNMVRTMDLKFNVPVLLSSFRSIWSDYCFPYPNNGTLCISGVLTWGSTAALSAVVVTTDASLDAEPQGFMNTDVVGRAPLIFITLFNATMAVVTLRAMPGLTLIEDRLLRIEFTNNAFDPPAYPNANVTSALQITVTKYVSEVVTHQVKLGVASAGVGALWLAGLAAPSVSMLLFQPNLVLMMFHCPDTEWKQTVFPFGSIQDPGDASLDQWMTVAGSTAAVLGVLVGMHLLVVFLVHIIRKGRYNKPTLQKYSKVTNRLAVAAAVMHFPTIPCVLIFFCAMPIVWYCGVTLVQSTAAGYRVISLLIMALFMIGFPFLVHGVVWRSYSLEFIPYKKFHFLLGPSGFWWNEGNPTYLPRYWVLVQETRRNTRWYLLAQYLGLVLVSFTLSVQPTTMDGCTARAAVVTSLFGVGLVALVLLRPFRIVLINYLYIAAFALQFAACVVLTRVSTDSIQSQSLLTVALGLVVSHVVVLQLISVAGVFCRCFAKPVPKAIARLEYRQEQRRKNRVFTEDVDFGDNRGGVVGKLDDGDELDPMEEDAEEVLHPGHPLFDRDDLPAKPQQGQFRMGHKGYVTGAEVAFSPSRRKELALRAQLHSELLDDTIEDPQVGANSSHVLDDTIKLSHLMQEAILQEEQEEEWSVERELEGLPPRRSSAPRDTSPQFPPADVRPSRLQIVEL